MSRGVISLLLNRDHILLNRFLVTPQLVQRITKLVVRFGIVWPDLNGLAQLVGGFRVTLEIVVTPAEVVLSSGVGGAQLEPALIRVRGFGKVLDVVVIDVGEAEMRETHIRI